MKQLIFLVMNKYHWSSQYTDDQFHVYERFIGFERVFGTTGADFFNLLVEWLKQLGLDIDNIVGQCYDGASTMRSRCKGVATRLINIVPTALYIHCNDHILSLCLIDVAQTVVPVRNTFGIMKSLDNLIEGSTKRHKVFEDIQKQIGLASMSLKKLCDTRWTCRFESLKVVLIRYSEIFSSDSFRRDWYCRCIYYAKSCTNIWFYYS